MKLADYVINFLQEQGIKDVFLVYGSANADLVDAFTRNDKINYVATMHEQGAGFAAEGYAQVNNNFGVALATSGPGGMNLITSMGNCYYESIPCLFITGQIKTQFLRKDDLIRQRGFQESDMVGMTKPVTKYSKMIIDPTTIKYELEKAVYIMKSGRPGPVLLDFPIDIQKAEIDPDKLEGHRPPKKDLISLLGFCAKLKKDLIKSKRPCFLIGGGAKNSPIIQQLMKKMKIPAFPTWNALDVVTSDNKYFGGRVGTYGGEGRNFAIQNCDLMICLGTRVSGRITGGNPSSFTRDAKKYMINLDSSLFNSDLHDVKFDETLECNVATFCAHFMKYIPETGYEKKEWLDYVMTMKERYGFQKSISVEDEDKVIDPYMFIQILSEECKKDDIIITDCGGNVVIMNQAFKTKIGQKFFSNNGNSPMGFSMCGAMGAWFASNNKIGKYRVICVIGDGGMNMNIQELQTLKNYEIGIKVFILNNHIYGITKAFQKTNFEGRMEACGPIGYSPPNFEQICEAYEIDYQIIDYNNEEYIRLMVMQALEWDNNAPLVVDVNIHEHHKYEPRVVGWDTPIEDMYPYIDRKEFEENMIIDIAHDYMNPATPNIKI